jgi:predicted glycosyltransferase
MIADKVMYTGLVAPPRAEPAAEEYDVVVSAGGGAAGGALIAAALDVAPESGLRWCIITGPNAMPVETKGAVALFRFRSDFPSLLMKARVSVSQAGYNTVCDILNARCGAVLVPFAQGGETEQSLRAAKLRALGLAEVVREDDLTPRRLAEAISSIAHPPRDHRLDLGGAHRTVQILKERLSLRNARST